MKTILLLSCGVALLGTVAPAVSLASQQTRGANGAPRLSADAVASSDAGDSLYRLGREALNDDDYRRAATLFKQVVDKYPTSASAGDALYWRAWSLYHLGVDRRNKTDLDDALASVERQQKSYAKASTSNDAKELFQRIRAAQANLGDSRAAGEVATEANKLQQSHGCSNADDEMRVAALQGLMSMNSTDALPILKQVLKQRDPCRVALRKQAVYMLSTKRSDDIVSTLLDVARNDPSPEVQGDAVYWLSTTRSDQATAALDSILFSGHETELRNKAVYALSQLKTERAGQALRRAAQDDKLPEEVRGQATYWLGQSRLADLDFFRALYKNTRSSNVHGQIIQAVVGLHSTEGTQWLIDMAKDKSLDAESRKNAIYWAGQERSVDLDQLAAIYDSARGDNDVQQQVIYVFSTRREPAAVDKLMAIAKSDSNIEMRKQALYWLGTKNDPRVKQFILDLINK